MNLLTETVTKIDFGDGMNSIWTGLGNAMGKVKDAVYGILPQLMTFLGDAWIILIPFGLFIIIKILNFFRQILSNFFIYFLLSFKILKLF